MNTRKSYENGKDVFDNKGQSTIDHIWPLSKNGSSSKKNIQYLTQESNVVKRNSTKGYINDIRFRIIKIERNKSNNKTIGQMSVLLDDRWINVIL